ncbi:hypothetical protein vBPFY1MI_162 [Pseudomonas phage vB_PF_Y1-MI]|nr:hypothetical protein vBPFY1MI_162 [Pseudomonas phage vB_PF_Y1-MI]
MSIVEYKARWKNMKTRCDDRYRERFPTYEGVSMCREWEDFDTFAIWMAAQPWKDRDLDKDILVRGNTVYGPETCRFVPHYVNAVLVGSSKNPNQALPIGVVEIKGQWRRTKPYKAQAQGVGSKIYLGTYSTPMGAHRAWQEYKIGVLCSVIDKYQMESEWYSEVVVALLERADELRSSIESCSETTNL